MKTQAVFLTVLCVLVAATSGAAFDGFLQLRVSTPLLASGVAGLRFGEADRGFRPALQVEAGIGGGKVAVGLDSTGQDQIGFALKAAFLRTWLAPLQVEDDQSFLGLEGEMGIHRLIVSLGGYGRVSDGEDDWLVSAGIGFEI